MSDHYEQGVQHTDAAITKLKALLTQVSQNPREAFSEHVSPTLKAAPSFLHGAAERLLRPNLGMRLSDGDKYQMALPSNENIKEAQWRGIDRALTLYGLDKTAGVLSTLGSALGRAGTGAAKAYQHGGGTMMQNAAKGAKAGWSGFQRAGGMQAAGKALGGAALAGGAAYGAGKAFGAGQQASQQSKMGSWFKSDKSQLGERESPRLKNWKS